jgi:hypothetical protein
VEERYPPTFASDQSFLDPQTSNDGSAYGPKRYKEIVRECWYISDHLNTSYTDVLNLSYQERLYLIECINEKIENTKRAYEEAQQKYRK